MKNILIIDVDTEREQPVMLGKPKDSPQPTNEEEAKTMILNDITCVCEALLGLISMSSANGYSNKERLVNVTISRLNDLLLENTDDNQQ